MIESGRSRERGDWHFYLNEEGKILNLALTAAPRCWCLKKPASWPIPKWNVSPRVACDRRIQLGIARE